MQLDLFVQYEYRHKIRYAYFIGVQRFFDDDEGIILYNDHTGSTVTKETILRRYDKRSEPNYE